MVKQRKGQVQRIGHEKGAFKKTNAKEKQEAIFYFWTLS
jgi:hypothetical protein